jgi:hypothetical protein
MRLRDYFVGQPVLLNSLHSPRIVAERINAAAGSIFSPFKRGVVGGVWLGRIRLRFVSRRDAVQAADKAAEVGS